MNDLKELAYTVLFIVVMLYGFATGIIFWLILVFGVVWGLVWSAMMLFPLLEDAKEDWDSSEPTVKGKLGSITRSTIVIVIFGGLFGGWERYFPFGQ